MVEFPLYFRRKPLGNKNFYKNQTDILTNPTTQCKIIRSNIVGFCRMVFIVKLYTSRNFLGTDKSCRTNWARKVEKWEKSCPMSKKKSIQNCCQKIWLCSEQKQESPKKSSPIFSEYQGRHIVQWKAKGKQFPGILIFP